jgi:hypothetical protein
MDSKQTFKAAYNVWQHGGSWGDAWAKFSKEPAPEAPELPEAMATIVVKPAAETTPEAKEASQSPYESWLAIEDDAERTEFYRAHRDSILPHISSKKV